MNKHSAAAKVQMLLANAERVGLLAELEQKALAQNDGRRQALAEELLHTLASRDALLAAPTAAMQQAAERYHAALRKFIEVEREKDGAAHAVFELQLSLEGKEGKLRSQMREIAPASLGDAWIKLHCLSNEVKTALRVREFEDRSVFPPRLVTESNVDVVFPLQAWLEAAKQEVEEMPYEAASAAELQKRCANLIAEAGKRALAVLGAAAIHESLGEAWQA